MTGIAAIWIDVQPDWLQRPYRCACGRHFLDRIGGNTESAEAGYDGFNGIADQAGRGGASASAVPRTCVRGKVPETTPVFPASHLGCEEVVYGPQM